MIKACIFDIDGTLIAAGADHIGESSVKAIKKLHENGYKVMIATGRGYYVVHNDVKELLDVDYFICVNGACVNDKNGEVYKSYPMSPEATEKLIDLCLQHDYPFAFKFADCMQVYNDYDYFVSQYCRKGISKEWISDNTKDRDYHLKNSMPLDAFIYARDGKPFTLAEEFDDLKFVYVWGVAHECFSITTNKGKTIRELVESVGIDLSECIAFGDSANDEEMIEMCGIGVAMGNAIDALKAKADYVTADINDDGIAKALEHFNLI